MIELLFRPRSTSVCWLFITLMAVFPVMLLAMTRWRTLPWSGRSYVGPTLDWNLPSFERPLVLLAVLLAATGCARHGSL
jgi:hypothetical protein